MVSSTLSKVNIAVSLSVIDNRGTHLVMISVVTEIVVVLLSFSTIL